MDNWVRIISFAYPHEAHMAKSLLEASGIEVIVIDEMTIQVYNFYSNAIGGVKLYVESSNVEEALLLLESGGYIVKEWSKAKDKIEFFSEEYKDLCPYCNSHNVVKKKMPGYIFVLSILLLSFPLPFLKGAYYCYDCFRDWKIDKNKK